MALLERIYLDHAATSPMHPEVIEKMVSSMNEVFGNPSSIHSFGRQARHAIDEARRIISTSIHAKGNEIIFTSGGTEADNLALLGIAQANRTNGRHIITTNVEHHAILHTCEYLEKQGFEVTYLPVNESGLISANQVEEALTAQTILVSVMYGNNEVGTLQPIREIGQVLKNHQAVFHTDAVQAFGLVPIDVKELGVDLLSVSAHKINGPKGTGFLYAKEGIKLTPHLYGGEQERKRRAGTENVAGIIGLSHAVTLSNQSIEERSKKYQEFQAAFLTTLSKNEVTFNRNTPLDHSLPHVLNIQFPGTNVESMLVNLDLEGVAASSGSACTAGSIDPSHVIVAMYGRDSDRISSSIRFSFGLGNTLEQIEQAATKTAVIVKRLTVK